jgi:asparagine synthase (glutamine-hydrolysing)
MTMAASLEARVPFLDFEVVEFLSHLPAKSKLRGLTTKWLLRRLMRERLPKAVLTMPKKGFSPPIPRWLRGPLFPYLQSKILDSPSCRQFFSRSYVEQLLAEYHSGKVDHNRRLWALLTFLHWADQSSKPCG